MLLLPSGIACGSPDDDGSAGATGGADSTGGTGSGGEVSTGGTGGSPVGTGGSAGLTLSNEADPVLEGPQGLIVFGMRGNFFVRAEFHLAAQKSGCETLAAEGSCVQELCQGTWATSLDLTGLKARLPGNVELAPTLTARGSYDAEVTLELAHGDPIQFSFPGSSEVPAFELEATYLEPIASPLTYNSEHSISVPLPLTWTNGRAGTFAEFALPNGGMGTERNLVCHWPATAGAGTVPASLLSQQFPGTSGYLYAVRSELTQVGEFQVELRAQTLARGADGDGLQLLFEE